MRTVQHAQGTRREGFVRERGCSAREEPEGLACAVTRERSLVRCSRGKQMRRPIAATPLRSGMSVRMRLPSDGDPHLVGTVTCRSTGGLAAGPPRQHVVATSLCALLWYRRPCFGRAGVAGRLRQHVGSAD